MITRINCIKLILTCCDQIIKNKKCIYFLYKSYLINKTVRRNVTVTVDTRLSLIAYSLGTQWLPTHSLCDGDSE
jgi:hypothetical protein